MCWYVQTFRFDHFSRYYILFYEFMIQFMKWFMSTCTNCSHPSGDMLLQLWTPFKFWNLFFNGFAMGTFCIDIKCPLWELLKGPMALQNSQNKLKLLTRWSWDKMAATLTDNIFKCNFVKDNVLIWIQISLNFVPKGGVDNKLSLVQVMAWCHQATSHYLSQCWPRSVSPYDITRPQWVTVKSLI